MKLAHLKFKTAFFHQFNLNLLHQATANKQQKKSLAKIRVAETINVNEMNFRNNLPSSNIECWLISFEAEWMNLILLKTVACVLSLFFSLFFSAAQPSNDTSQELEQTAKIRLKSNHIVPSFSHLARTMSWNHFSHMNRINPRISEHSYLYSIILIHYH